MRKMIAVTFLSIACFGVSECNQNEKVLRAEFAAMGSIPVNISGYRTRQEVFHQAVEAYRLDLQNMDSLLSVFKKNSLLNQAARGHLVQINQEIENLLLQAIRVSRISSGAFDPTVLPVIELWRQAKKRNRPPEPNELRAAVSKVGIAHIKFQKNAGKTYLSLDPGTSLDLGGIAKGYFADLGAMHLRKAGIQRGLVEIGGDLVMYDDSDSPQPFQIGIRHPRQKGAFLGKLVIDSGAVVTSGDYERFLQIGTKRYNHIIDPRTGRPTEHVCAVTLTAPTGVLADALATAIMVLGENDGMKLVRQLDGIDAMIVTESFGGRLKIIMSPNMKTRFHRQ